MMWIVYDPAAAYPQAPRPGEGVVIRGGHTPPSGMASFEFDAQGLRNDDVIREYRVTAPGILTRKDQEDIDAEEAERIRPVRVQEAHTEASRRRNILLGSPSDDSDTALRNFLSLTARATGKVRREAKGRGKPGEAAVLDQLESLTDGLEQIDAARDSIISEIQASSDPASIDIRNHPSWP